ncbi:MAG: ABC transporter ATP-binding protein [Hyphomicrobium sp.]
MTVHALIMRFLPYTARVRTDAVIAALLVLLAPLVAAGLLWSFKVLIDEVLIAGHTDMLATLALIYVAATLAKMAIGYASQIYEARVVEALVQALRGDLYSHVLSLSPGSLDTEATGDVLARLQGDTDRTEYLIFTGPLAVAADGAAALVFIAVLVALDWRLAALVLVALPVIVAVVQRLSPLVRQTSRLARRAESLWMALAEERLSARALVQAFAMETDEGRAFRRRCGRVRRMQIVSATLQARQAVLVEAAVALAGLAVLALSARLIGAGQLTVGTLIALIGAVGSLNYPVRALAKSAGRFQSAAAGAQRVAALLDRPSRVQDRPGARMLNFVRGNISFRNVSFAYDGRAGIVHDVSLDITAGETLALVGPSGSGKSSLLRLLMRQYDVDRGAVLIDGHDVRTLKRDVLRHAIAPVFQDALVLNGSIERNIAYGATGATRSDISRAAAAAAIDVSALYTDGLRTTVGVNGHRLSGGQRQRVALARALIKQAPILLLDEATAGIDSETEEHISKALDQLAGRCTTLIVAHRLSTVRRVDRVAVLDGGRIVEVGRPADLLARPSRCRALFAAQIAMTEAA